jgi:hypothetical protein
VKTGGRLVKHARYYWLLLAEGHLPPAAVRQHAAPDLGAADAGGLTVRLDRRISSKKRSRESGVEKIAVGIRASIGSRLDSG